MHLIVCFSFCWLISSFLSLHRLSSVVIVEVRLFVWKHSNTILRVIAEQKIFIYLYLASQTRLPTPGLDWSKRGIERLSKRSISQTESLTERPSLITRSFSALAITDHNQQLGKHILLANNPEENHRQHPHLAQPSKWST